MIEQKLILLMHNNGQRIRCFSPPGQMTPDAFTRAVLNTAASCGLDIRAAVVVVYTATEDMILSYLKDCWEESPLTHPAPEPARTDLFPRNAYDK